VTFEWAKVTKTLVTAKLPPTGLTALGFSFFWAKPKGQEIDTIKIVLN
jgi:hypothetical protein